jgi:hypothetical protein
MKRHVGSDGVGGRFGVDQVIVSGLEGGELVRSGAFRSEAGVFGFDDEAEFDELAKTLYFIGHQEMEGVAERFVQAVDGANAEALPDFEQALLFEAFGGLTNDAAGDAELRGKLAFGGEEGVTIARCLGADEVGEALADFFNERRWTVEGRESHKTVIRWSDQ